MSLTSQPHTVLFVTSPLKDEEALRDTLTPPHFARGEVLFSASKARMRQSVSPADIVVINLPLPDEYGTKLAADLTADRYTGVLLLCPGEAYEQVADEMEPLGVFTLKKPCSRQTMYQAARLLTAALAKVTEYERRTTALQASVDEIRLVSRAKWVLISQMDMDEKAAHRYIEKRAMDERKTRGEIARQILSAYDN